LGRTEVLGPSDLNGRFTAANLAWSLVEIGHQETVEALLQFSGSLAMFSRKPSFNRRRLSLAPDRLQCSDSCPSE
jgi:hypothetical protein